MAKVFASVAGWACKNDKDILSASICLALGPVEGLNITSAAAEAMASVACFIAPIASVVDFSIAERLSVAAFSMAFMASVVACFIASNWVFAASLVAVAAWMACSVQSPAVRE